jgi:coproporphyrinogen III oxidase-like Fe-S oxidoreductase
LKRIEKVSEQLRERKIAFEVSLIFGLPHQTIDSFKRSVDYCVNTIKPSKIDAWPLMLLRGTELEQSKEKYELEEEIIPTHQSISLSKERIYLGIPHVTSSPSFSKSDWLEMLNISTNLNK